MTKLDDALAGVTRLGLDSAPVIYYIEAHPRYDALVSDVFGRVADGRLGACTSVITLGEVLVHPLSHGNIRLISAYRNLLMTSEHLSLLPTGPSTAELAASLRARSRLRMPDALQIASSLEAGCQAFLTNDASLRQVDAIRVLVLDDLMG